MSENECKHGCSLEGLCGFCNQEKADFDPYHVTIGGIRLDPYLIATAFDLPPAVAEALKKLLRLGRKHKTREQDLAEAIQTLQRQQEIDKELGK